MSQNVNGYFPQNAVLYGTVFPFQDPEFPIDNGIPHFFLSHGNFFEKARQIFAQKKVSDGDSAIGYHFTHKILQVSIYI